MNNEANEQDKYNWMSAEELHRALSDPALPSQDASLLTQVIARKYESTPSEALEQALADKTLSQLSRDVIKDTLTTRKDVFGNACAAYMQGKYKKARSLFQRQLQYSASTDEGKLSRVQLLFLKSDPSTTNVATIVFTIVLFSLFKDHSPGIVIFSAYFAIGIATLYWMYRSFRWPIVFQAKKQLGAAIGWLIFVGASTILFSLLAIAGVLDITSVFPGSPPSIEENFMLLFAGSVFLVTALLANRLSPLVCMFALTLLAIVLAITTAPVFSLCALSAFAGKFELAVPLCGNSVIKLMALYSVSQGIGACRALDALKE